MVTAGPSNMAQDTEFAVPQPPSAVRRSSSKSKGSTDQEAYHSKRAPRRVGPCRTSLEDTIENLVELPLSSELLSTRAKADLAFHQRQSRALRHSTSQHSINSFGDSSEPLGPATPGIEAYKRPSSSGSSSSGGFIHDYYTSDPHEEGHIPRPELPYESQALQHRRPSTSSQASDTSRSRIPVPSNGLSKSWSASDGLATKSSRVNAETGTPRSTSHNSALADHLTMALPKRTSSRRQQSRPDQPGRTNQVKDTSNQQQPRPAASRQGHPAASQHTPTRASGKRVGDNYQSTSSRRNPALETKSTPLGSKRAPRAPAGGAGGAAQPRSRAVTGNAGTQRPAKEVLQKQSRSRSRSQSASGFDDAAAASQMDGPPLGDAAPVMYRSDHISKSKTSDSLADLARDRRREDEEHARLDQARTWDDVVIPTVAKQLHQQELLEQAIAQDEAERARKAEEAQRARQEDYQRAVDQASPEKHYQPPPQAEEPRRQRPSQELLPDPPPIAPAQQEALSRSRRPSNLGVDSNRNRKEVWEMPGLDSPGTAQNQLKNQHQQVPPAKGAATSPQDEHQGGCCSSCVII